MKMAFFEGLQKVLKVKKIKFKKDQFKVSQEGLGLATGNILYGGGKAIYKTGNYAFQGLVQASKREASRYKK